MIMKTILVVYHSQEKGNTRRMAELVAQGARAVEGAKVSMIDVNETRVEMDIAEGADAYAVGSPDYFSYPAGNVKQFCDDILLADWQGRATTGKPCICFITHGGGGAALAAMEKLAKAAKLDQILPGLSCQGAPEKDEDVAACIELGRSFAQQVIGL